MNIREQAEGILVRFIVGNVAVHQKQIRLGRFSQAPAEFVGLGIQAHAEIFRKNPLNVVQNCRIGVKNCDLGLAWARNLHRPHILCARHSATFIPDKTSCEIFSFLMQALLQRWTNNSHRPQQGISACGDKSTTKSGKSIPTNANSCTTRSADSIEMTRFNPKEITNYAL